MFVPQDSFETDVLGSAEPVLVDFYGTWCGPCKVVAPAVEKLAGEGYRVCKVNIQARPELTAEYRVGAVPTLLVLKGGKEVARFVGIQSEKTLRDALDRARQPS